MFRRDAFDPQSAPSLEAEGFAFLLEERDPELAPQEWQLPTIGDPFYDKGVEWIARSIEQVEGKDPNPIGSTVDIMLARDNFMASYAAYREAGDKKGARIAAFRVAEIESWRDKRLKFVVWAARAGLSYETGLKTWQASAPKRHEWQTRKPFHSM